VGYSRETEFGVVQYNILSPAESLEVSTVDGPIKVGPIFFGPGLAAGTADFTFYEHDGTTPYFSFIVSDECTLPPAEYPNGLVITADNGPANVFVHLVTPAV
jgi:hypothetical protein